MEEVVVLLEDAAILPHSIVMNGSNSPNVDVVDEALVAHDSPSGCAAHFAQKLVLSAELQPALEREKRAIYETDAIQELVGISNTR